VQIWGDFGELSNSNGGIRAIDFFRNDDFS
jgi:hypothetical protein